MLVVDPIDALEAKLEIIGKTESIVRAWESVDADGARAQARALGRGSSIHEGQPLRGLIVGVKDVIDVAGLPTKAGSRARSSIEPAVADATVIARLREAGCIILGKLKTTEFAYTDPTDTTNPANPLHTPGGSSSGSAAAIAAGSADLTLGTQTVGSVCRPAAYCGVTAFKPSTRLTPMQNVVPFSSTFDTIGFFSRDMRIAVNAFRVCCGLDGVDFAAPPAPCPTISWKGLRIGVIVDHFYSNCDYAILEALERARSGLVERGAQISEIDVGIDHEALREHQRTVIFHEAAQAHWRLLRQPELLGPNWRMALERGTSVSEVDYREAIDHINLTRKRIAVACAPVDFMLLPPVREPAPLGLHSTGDAGLISTWTVFGGPLAILPFGATSSGLPIAVMIAGRPQMDVQTAKFATALQENLGVA